MQSIYQDQLLALARSVRESSSIQLTEPTHKAEVNNPVCGDIIEVFITVENNVITAAHAKAKGCALCEEGAGLWLNSVIGQTMSSLSGYHIAMTNWLAGQDETDTLVKFGDGLECFLPVRPIKNRHKCVSLAFSTADKFTTA